MTSSRGPGWLTRWAVLVASVTIVLAVGGPLVGRGVFIGVDIIRTFSPWNADTPTDFEYRHGPVDDTVNAGTPARILIREGLVHDRNLLLWNPYPNGGTPLGSQPDTGLLSPLNWPELVLGVKFGAAWAALLRFAVAAVGAYYLLRRLGVSRFAGVCGGLIYSLNGFILFWTNWPQGEIAALIPALFLTADILRERRRARDVALFAVVIASMLLEGYPPLVLATLYALAGFLVVRWWESAHPQDDEALQFRDRARRSVARLRDAVTPTALIVGAGALGAAIAAFQLLPFLSRLGEYDTSYRSLDEHTGFHAAALLTSVFPGAFGDQTQIGRDAFTNFLPTGRMFFMGATTVLLALWAVVRGRPERVSRGTYRYCLVGAVVMLLVLVGNPEDAWSLVNGPMTTLLYALPGMNQVPLVRLVALFLFFVALLAGFGVERVVAQTDPRPSRTPGRWRVRLGVVAALVTGYALLAIHSEHHLLSKTMVVGDRVIRVLGDRSWILRSTIVPALLLATTVLVIVAARRVDNPRRWLAIGAIPVLLAIESLMVTTPWLPRAPTADFYPETPALRYLDRHLDDERFAAPDRMLFPSTNSYYGLRSVTGHSFALPAWRDLVEVSSPGTFGAPTQTLLGNGIETATSPVLDQLSARYFVAFADRTPFGRLEAAPAGTRTTKLARVAPLTGAVGAGPLRGIGLTLVGPTRLNGTVAFLDATVRDTSGTVVARGSRRITSTTKTTDASIPIAGEHLRSPVTPWRVEIALRSNAPDTVSISATADGSAALGTIRPEADGLELVHADAGAVIYRRTTALHRVRWASRSTVITNPQRQVDRIAGGIDADTVILDQPGPPADGRPARVTVHEDTGDHIRATVRADGAGYLVIADAIQDGWTARLDGEPATIRNANHAITAIAVPRGTHTITLDASPHGWRAGIAISIAATLIVVALLGWSFLRRRRPGLDHPAV